MRRLQGYTGVRERLLRVYLFFWNGLTQSDRNPTRAQGAPAPLVREGAGGVSSYVFSGCSAEL